MAARALGYPFPVRQWRQPSDDILSDQSSPGGRPSFDPFLTATLIWEAHLCPIAAIHSLFHGIEVRLGIRGHPNRQAGPRGSDWHGYIADLRARVASQSIMLPPEIAPAIERIHEDFRSWSTQHFPGTDTSHFWTENVEPYIRLRLNNGDLYNIVGHSLLSEVTIGSAHVQVPFGNGVRNYPIEARVDEIDLTAGSLIERTVETNPAVIPVKTVQIAVEARILNSLPAAGIPQEWMLVRNIRNFFIETPTGTYQVDPNTETLYNSIHEAAAIIKDLASSELSEGNMYNFAQCTPNNPHDICSHPYINCFYHVPTFPRARNPIRQETRALSRAELYELMWQKDLTKYRLYRPAIAQNAFPGLILSIHGTGEDDHGQYVRATIQEGPTDLEQGIFIVGTQFIGIQRSARIRGVGQDVRVYCRLGGLPLPNTGILWPIAEQGLLMEQAPHFLIPLRQSRLFQLRKMGTARLDLYNDSDVLRLIDAIFLGVPPLVT